MHVKDPRGFGCALSMQWWSDAHDAALQGLNHASTAGSIRHMQAVHVACAQGATCGTTYLPLIFLQLR